MLDALGFPSAVADLMQARKIGMAIRQPKVFISYRRSDTSGVVHSVKDALRARFGHGNVVLDEEAVKGGDDFVDVLRSRLGECDLLLALIGPEWLVDSSGKRRFDDPRDYVKFEIDSALRFGLHILPVLLEGVAMPSAAELPQSMARFARRQAMRLSNQSFATDLDAVCDEVERKGVLRKNLRRFEYQSGPASPLPVEKSEPPDEPQMAELPAAGPGANAAKRNSEVRDFLYLIAGVAFWYWVAKQFGWI